MATPIRIEYWLNGLDEIVHVNEAWLPFALANDGVGLASERILTHPLFEFITDSTTRRLYWDMLKVVRAGHPLQFPFRCDSPSQRRLLEMTIRLDQAGLVKFSTIELLVEARTPIRLLASSTRRSTTSVRICSWCKRVETENQQWVEIEDAMLYWRPSKRDRLPRLKHTVCNYCLTTLKKTGRIGFPEIQ